MEQFQASYTQPCFSIQFVIGTKSAGVLGMRLNNKESVGLLKGDLLRTDGEPCFACIAADLTSYLHGLSKNCEERSPAADGNLHGH